MQKIAKTFFILLAIFLFCLATNPASAEESCARDSDCAIYEQNGLKMFCDIPGGQFEGLCSIPKSTGEPCLYNEQCQSQTCYQGKCVIPAGQTCPESPADCISGECLDLLIGKTCICTSQNHCPDDKFCSSFKSCEKKYPNGASCTEQTQMACQSGTCDIPIGETNGKCGILSNVNSEPTTPTEPLTSAQTKLTAPELTIPIPGFSGFSQQELKQGELNGFAWIPQYITAVFNYAITIGSILAAVILLVGGVNYLLAGANITQQNTAKDTIIGALVGLIIFTSSYLLLKLINPALVTLESMSIDVLQENLLDPSIVETRSFNPPGRSDKTTFLCNAAGKAIHRKTGKLLDISKIRGNGWDFSPHYGQTGIPFYETDHGMMQRTRTPDLIIIHTTAGNNFLNASSKYGGPAVHYLVDRNGDVAQLIYEEQYTYSVKNKDAAKRAISYEIVNLYDVCGGIGYQTKNRRRFGVDPENIYKKHPLCLDVKTITAKQVNGTCPCAKLENPKYKKKCFEEFSSDQFAAVARLTAWVAKRYNIPIVHPIDTNPTQGKNCPSSSTFGYCWNGAAGIVGHADLQGDTHGDPGPAWDWDKFLDLVKSYQSSVPSITFNAKDYNDNLFK